MHELHSLAPESEARELLPYSDHVPEVRIRHLQADPCFLTLLECLDTMIAHQYRSHYPHDPIHRVPFTCRHLHSLGCGVLQLVCDTCDL